VTVVANEAVAPLPTQAKVGVPVNPERQVPDVVFPARVLGKVAFPKEDELQAS